MTSSKMDVPRLHPETIAAVKQRVDIYDVVADRVVLKKQGKDFVGLCPFHDDKSPSFSVSPAKQFYYCFSCGAGGDAIKFLTELDKREFSDVVLDLARRYQIPIKTLEPEKRQELQRQLTVREQLYEILALTARFYEHALLQPQGATALEYLQQQRKFSLQTIQQFQLGYAPIGWETLYGYLVHQKHYPAELVERAGLIVPRQNASGYYDRFRDRLMIPIHDLQGRVIGFGGRSLGDEQPKYLNSPETELFDKGQTLFCLDKARQAIAKLDQAVVVEGYFDAIALHAAGISQVVASLGTALSQNQIKQLLRYTESKQVIFNFDADTAGVKAAQRAIGEMANLAYLGQVQLRILNIPDGKDPDEFLRNHPVSEYRQLLQSAPLWLDWQIQQMVGIRDLRQADQFQQAVQEVVTLLGQLPNAPLRTHYLHRCAELLSPDDARVALQLEEDLRNQVKGQRWHGRAQKWETAGDRSLRQVAEAQLLKIYLHHPSHRVAVLTALRRRDLAIGIAQHITLWQAILQVQESQTGIDVTEPFNPQMPPPEWQVLADLDLPQLIQTWLLEHQQDLSPLMPFLQLDELGQSEIARPTLNIQVAAATLEQIACEKRCRHLLKLWSETEVKAIQDCLAHILAEGNGAVVPEDEAIGDLYQRLNQESLKFHQLYMDERQYLQQLQQQRRVSFEQIMQFSAEEV